MHSKIEKILVLALTFLLSCQVAANQELMDKLGGQWTVYELDRIDERHGTIYVRGEILPGDFERFESLYASSDKPVTRLAIIHSPGGNLYEAMNIGWLVRENLLEVNVFGQCDSACALIAIANAAPSYFYDNADDLRSGAHKDIGFHRPRFQSEYYESQSLDDVRRLTEKLTEDVSDYSKKMGMSERIFDWMMATPSHQIWRISLSSYYREVGFNSAVEEWIIGNCGRISVQERDDLALALSKNQTTVSSSNKEYLIDKFHKVRSCTNELLKSESARKWSQYKDANS